MITLYQLHWSHYVEKVRWALDYKGLDWSAIDVDAFTKRQMHRLPCKLTLDSGRSLYTVHADPQRDRRHSANRLASTSPGRATHFQ